MWTGTRPDGTAVPGTSHCADWTSDSLLIEDGYYGYTKGEGGWWTLDPDPEINPTTCIAAFRLYCIEGK